MDASSAIQILISAKDEASETLKGIGEHMSSLGDSAKEYLGEGFKKAAEVGAEGLLALGEVARESIGDAQKYNQQLAGLKAELISTKDASGETVTGLQDMADEMERATGINHSAIMSAQNMELTFTNIGKGVFPDVTQAALDMGTAFNNGALPNGEQLQNQMVQLGKALNDPAKGLHALQRVGVSFSATETAAIKTAMAHNDVMGAQKVMLGELATEFGGRAAAAGNTFYGTLSKLNNVVDGLKEQMGNMLIGVLTPLIGKIQEFVANIDWETVTMQAHDAIQNLTTALGNFIRPIAEFLSAHAQQIIGFFHDYGKEIAMIIPVMAILAGAFAVLSNPLVGITLAVVLLTVAWKEIHKWWESSSPVVNVLKQAMEMWWVQIQGIWSAIKTQLFPALQQLWQVLEPVLLPALKAIGIILGGAIFIAITAVLGGVRLLVTVFSDFINTVRIISSELEKLFGWLNKMTGASNVLSSIMKAGGGAITSIEHAIEHRATGGSVSAGTTYNVNEREPEFFTPTQGGTVTPLSKMPGGAGGGHTINVSMGSVQVQNQTTADYLSEQIGKTVIKALNGAY